jgi:hypothetical protein
MRSSPIVCFFDSITLLLRVAIEAFDGRSIPLAIRGTLTVRFEGADEVGGQPTEMEKLPFIRFLFVALPAAVQAVKLFALQGLPWTHRWGFCYIFSFALNEILVFINRGQLFGVRYLPPQDHTPLNTQSAQTQNSRFLRTAERWIGIAAIVLQFFAFGFFVTGDRIKHVPNSGFPHAFFLFPLLLPVLLPPFLLICCGMFLGNTVLSIFYAFSEWVMTRPSIMDSGRVLRFSVICLLLVAAFGLFGLSFLGTASLFIRWIRNGEEPRLTPIGQALGVFVDVLLSFLFVDFLAWMCRPFRRAVLLLDDDPVSQIVGAACAFKFFLGNFVVGLLFYGYLYDPAGTVKPSWAELLG